MKHWTIYCHIHNDSGRRYIGLTSQTMEKRWKNHINAAYTKAKGGRWHFPNAIRKYGKDAFSHHIIQTLETVTEANVWESFWIDYFNTRDSKFGFNVLIGGSHKSPSQNYKDSSEFQANKSASSKKMWKDPEFRKNVTDGVKRAWKDPDYRARMTAISQEVNSRPEVKAKISATVRTNKSSRFRGVCFNKTLGKWRAYIRQNMKMKNLGHFDSEEGAARRYDIEARVVFGYLANLNFPELT